MDGTDQRDEEVARRLQTIKEKVEAKTPELFEESQWTNFFEMVATMIHEEEPNQSIANTVRCIVGLIEYGVSSENALRKISLVQSDFKKELKEYVPPAMADFLFINVAYPPDQAAADVTAGSRPFGGSPFNMAHLETVRSTRNYGESFPAFCGRDGFAATLKDCITKLITQDLINVQFRGNTYCFSSSSGVGKTRGLLELKDSLAALMPDHDVFFGYTGFNSGLPLSSEEKSYIKDEITASNVLARRMLGSVVVSFLGKKNGTFLPLFEDLYGGREMPEENESINQLVDFVHKKRTKQKQLPIVVVGVDEVQILNSQTVSSGNEEIRVGRLFLRILRTLQVELFKRKIVLVPVGTGILLDFRDDPSRGDNKLIYSATNSGTLLIEKEKFRDLVIGKRKISESQSYIDSNLTFMVPRIVSSLLWPHVRRLEGWNGEDCPETEISSDSNGNYKEWMLRWMLNADFDISETKYAPGCPNNNAVNDGITTAVFVLPRAGRFRVIPDAASSRHICRALSETVESDGMKKLFNGLNTIASTLQRAVFTSVIPDSGEFERLGFYVVASSLYLGLEALKRKDTIHGSSLEFESPDKRNRRLALAKITREKFQSMNPPQEPPSGEPMVLVPHANRAHYPFSASVNNKEGDLKQRQFVEDFVLKLRAAAAESRPVFVRTGKDAKCDYLFLYPLKTTEDADTIMWFSHIGDAKLDSAELPGNVTTKSQKQVEDVETILRHAMNCAGMELTMTNRFVLSTANGQITGNDQSLLLLCPSTFEFAPFTDILFAYQLGLQEAEAAGPKKKPKL